MKFQIDPHTLERAEERGANKEEIEDVVQTGSVVPAKGGRISKAKVYSFERERHGKFYEQKRVQVVYIVEKNVIITVTVYVFYGKWENENADTL